MSPRSKGAILIGVALVGAALLVSQYRTPVATPEAQPIVTETPTFMAESALREYIVVEDSNNDGIPDWQELLNDTEPLDLPATTTEFTEPETLTDQFALEFFETYVRNEGFGAFSRDPQDIINSASNELVAQAQDDLYFEQDITIVSATPGDITDYANEVAAVIDSTRLPPGTQNELTIVEQAVAQNNPDVLAELSVIIENYDRIIERMKTIPVPTRMVKEHLDLLNTLQAVRNGIASMQTLFVDPINALLRIQRFEDDVRGLSVAFVNLFEKANDIGSGFSRGDAVFSVYSFQ